MRFPHANVTILMVARRDARALATTIDSVMAQTHLNWEFLILDNAGPADIARELEDFSRRDPRIRIKRVAEALTENQAMNRLYSEVPPASSYCKPLVEGDWIAPDCIESMLGPAEARASIGLVCCYAFDGRFRSDHGFPYPAPFVAGEDAVRFALRTLGEAGTFGSPTTMLFRSNVVRERQPFLDEWNPFSDREVCVEVLQKWDFAFVHQMLALSRVRIVELAGPDAIGTGSVPASDAHLLHRFGPLYLNEQERMQRRARVMSGFYRVLALCNRNHKCNAARAFHLDMLRRMGMRYSRIEVTKAALRERFWPRPNPFHVTPVE